MKSRIFFILVLIFAGFSSKINSQAFTFTSQLQVKADTLGRVINFDGTITSTSAETLRLCLIRTINSMPHSDWSSAICFDENCYPSSFDSVATTPEFQSKPLPPGGTKPFGLHVFTSTINGTATVQYTLKNMANLNEKRVLTFTASTLLSSNKENNFLNNGFNLFQNYPNPFSQSQTNKSNNPSTDIKFQTAKRSFVTLKLYDLQGKEIASLINEEKDSGIHTYRLAVNNYSLTSGIYFYRIFITDVLNNKIIYTKTKKMILEK